MSSNTISDNVNDGLTLTTEQVNIIEAFNAGNNIKIISGPGCGKTSTLYHIFKNSKNKDNDYLYITYNKRLKIEAREKFDNYGNVEAHSFDSVIYNYFVDSKKNPPYLIKDLKTPINLENKFDVLFIDEAQDINNLYFKLINKIININKIKQIVIVGDPNQSIFKHNGADIKYLLNIEKLIKRPFVEYKLSISFRVPSNVSKFINVHLCDKNIINSYKDGGSVYYHLVNSFNIKIMYNLIVLKCNQFGQENVVILSPDNPSKGKETKPIKQIANKLSIENNGINLYVSGMTEVLNDELIKNKLCICSFHTFKGLERKCVIVTGISKMYDRYYNRDNDKIPNPMYVAFTRTSDELHIIHGAKGRWRNDYYRTIKVDQLKDFCKVIGTCGKFKKNPETCKSSDHLKDESVTWLTKNVNENKFVDVYNNNIITNKFNKLDLITIENALNIIKFDETSEDISYLYGSIPVMIHEFVINKKINFYESINPRFEQLISNNQYYIDGKALYDTKIKNLQFDNLMIKDFAYLCNIRQCIFGYIYPLKQITNYEWVDEKFVMNCYNNYVKIINHIQLSENIKESDLNYEYPIRANFKLKCTLKNENIICNDEKIQIIRGRCDLITPNRVYEFKVSSSTNITTANKIQCLTYSELYNKPITLININFGTYTEFNNRPKDFIYNVLRIKDNLFMSFYDERDNLIKSIQDDVTILYNTDFIKNSTMATKLLNNVNSILNSIVVINNNIETKKLILDSDFVPETIPENIIEKSQEMMDMILDVETTGFPRTAGLSPDESYKYSDRFKNARMIELAFIKCNKKGEIVKTYSSIIKPDGFSIKNHRIHGITNKKAINEGKSINDVLMELKDELYNVDNIVAHNIKFDTSIILSELYRVQDLESIAKIQNSTYTCTLKLSKSKLKIKSHKLSNVYNYLFDDEFKQEHRALSDTVCCMKCYTSLIKLPNI